MYGLIKTTSMGGARNFITFIDDFSRNVCVYMLKSKEDCLEKFKEFKALVEKYDWTITCRHFDRTIVGSSFPSNSNSVLKNMALRSKYPSYISLNKLEW